MKLMKTAPAGIALFLSLLFSCQRNEKQDITEGTEAREKPGPEKTLVSPDWLKGLVIYEIAPKAYTSPDGPESGTFNSLRQRIPYLADLGITGIWLTGHSLSDPRHFYNIWTQYANVHPAIIDSTLGTEEEFKALVDECHARGIKVFLDVITHGVMSHSPLTKQHPEWFCGGSWEMTDFAWQDTIQALDDWWVEVWTNYVLDYGIDGFRLDLGMERPDLWRHIRHNAYQAGHPIIIFPEANRANCNKYGDISRVADFLQQDIALAPLERQLISQRWNYWPRERWDNFLAVFSGKEGCAFSQADGALRKDPATGRTHYLQLNMHAVSSGASGRGPAKRSDTIPFTSNTQLAFGRFEDGKKAMRLIENGKLSGGLYMPGNSWITRAERQGDTLYVDMDIAQCWDAGWRSIALSCHDEGWGRVPANPYIAGGSRFAFGYALLFPGGVPIFMSGEEFNCSYRPLPRLSPRLYDGSEPGRGTWLYGSWIDWGQLEKPAHRDMLEDVRKMLNIRKQYADVLGAIAPGSEPNICTVPTQAEKNCPQAYMRWGGGIAFVIVGNNSNEPLHVAIKPPLARAGLDHAEKLQVTELMGGQRLTMDNSEDFTIKTRVGKDYSKKGGVKLFMIKEKK
jgi:hypothetical protein